MIDFGNGENSEAENSRLWLRAAEEDRGARPLSKGYHRTVSTSYPAIEKIRTAKVVLLAVSGELPTKLSEEQSVFEQ